MLFGLAGLALVAGASLVALHPAAAAGALAAFASTVNCATSSACVSGNNSKAGPGVAGFSTQGYGVYGSTNGKIGIYGTTSSGRGYGVAGSVSNGIGLYGTTDTGYAVYGIALKSGIGLFGVGESGGEAAHLVNDYGTGLAVFTQGGDGIDVSSTRNGADIDGTAIGVIGRASVHGGYPLMLTDESLNDLFYVDGSGNVFYHGGLYNFARTPDGGTVRSFSAKSTLPTVEDTGSAQLVNGSADVRLDPTFAASIDAASSYRVFLTPNGDTRGLYIAAKRPGGFVVRETQGGRSTLAFDYRIVATAAGQGGQRMSFMKVSDLPYAARPARRAK